MIAPSFPIAASQKLSCGEHDTEAEERRIRRKASGAALVRLRHNVVHDDVQHRPGGERQRKGQYRPRQAHGKVSEEHADDLDHPRYDRHDDRTPLPRTV